ncbi:MAG: Integrase core domain protein [Planctomycetaceae bacterium]|nr:Integrase core domain protein [Planctomycetaceae bacterium]
MSRILHPLFALLASATRQDLARQVAYLKEENRIPGELRRLEIRKINRQTVKNILKEHGLDPGPQRGQGTWVEFLKVHADTLWQCELYFPLNRENKPSLMRMSWQNSVLGSRVIG